MGIEEILMVVDDGVVRAPVFDCRKHDINLAAAQVVSEMDFYIARYQAARRAEAERQEDNQPRLKFRGFIQCGQRDMRNCLSKDEAVRRIIAKNNG